MPPSTLNAGVGLRGRPAQQEGGRSAAGRRRQNAGSKSLRFEWGCQCLVFYLSIGYCILYFACMLLRIGPFAPPPALQPWIRPREWVKTSTEPPFTMFVHPVSEDRFISLELHQYGMWEEPLSRRILEVLRTAEPDRVRTQVFSKFYSNF